MLIPDCTRPEGTTTSPLPVYSLQAMKEGRHAGAAAGQLLADIEWKRGGCIGEAKSRAIFEKLFENGWHVA